MTPMMEQYFEIKNKYKDYLLFYRLGDFYEMFFDDAILASRELELTLTGRDCGESERAPMCGVPFHSSDSYIGRLIDKGYKVAICEQVEDPALAKGLVKREVIRVVTPGTLIETDLLKEGQNNYLCALYIGSNGSGISFADISTAQVYATSFYGDEDEEKLINEIATYSPSEIIVNLSASEFQRIYTFIKNRTNAIVSDRQAWRFEDGEALKRSRLQFSLEEDHPMLKDKEAYRSVGALLSYIEDTKKSDISYINSLSYYSDGRYMEIDVNTRRNLELVETMRSKEKKGSLLWVLDKTKTSPGARLLRNWVEHPLLDRSVILKRQKAVEELFGDYMKREELSALLADVLDLERLVTKIVYGTANGKDLRAVANTVKLLPEIKALITNSESAEMTRIYNELDLLSDIYEKIDNAIAEVPPFSVREGDIIKDGYNSDVDYLRSIKNNGKNWKNTIEESEREATGIKNLKIGYNKVFGYYIEVTKSYASLVPDRYIRKQTLVNCERYITDELKDMEATVLGAADKVNTLEFELFNEIRMYTSDNSTRIRKVAALLAELDVYVSLASVAAKNRYCRPEIGVGKEIVIKDGRHPVVEQFVKNTYFVPNDTDLNTTDKRLMLITGPNMAGKSTYMRQVALITIMAQIGSFVPCAEAEISIVDKVFTRVGASDDLASGQSTFMLEMNEVAYILKNATRDSLIIYDEVGRGTSTYDGMSIARAIIEYTNSKKIGAKTLFATHYHELTSLEDEYEGIVNYNIAAKKRGDDITFLRKIVKGSTDDSYGIEVAKLAGVPNEVIKRAKEVLASVESTARAIKDQSAPERKDTVDDGLITIDDCINDQIIAELKAVDLDTLSPIECMTLLYNIKRRII